MKELKLCHGGKEVQETNSSFGSLKSLMGEEGIFQVTRKVIQNVLGRERGKSIIDRRNNAYH